MKIRKEITVPEFIAYVRSIQNCGDHPLPHLTDTVLESTERIIDCYIEDAESYEDTCSKILVERADGQLGLFEEWSDSSGHG